MKTIEDPSSTSVQVWLFAILGALVGLMLNLLMQSKFGGEFLIGTTMLVALSAALSIGLVGKRAGGVLAVFSCVYLGSNAWWLYVGYLQIDTLLLFFALGMCGAVLISTSFVQSWRDTRPHFEYQDLFDHAWNNVLLAMFAVLFMSVGLLVILLGTVLFDTVGISQLTEWVWNENSWPIVTGTLIGIGIGVSRRYSAIVLRLRPLVFGLLNLLGVLTALIVVVFGLSLPFTLDELFGKGSAASVLLALVAVSILFLNTLTEQGSDTLSSWQSWLYRIQIGLLPIFTGLSLYAFSLRIDQYGLMPERVLGVLVALVLLAHSLAYAYQMLRLQRRWSAGLPVVNPGLAAMSLLLLLLLFTTVLDPVRWSVNQQMARLKDGRVSVEKFDFHALYLLGYRGKTALAEMEQWQDYPERAALLAAIQSAGMEPSELQLEIVPDPALPVNLPALKVRLASAGCDGTRGQCLLIMLPVGEQGRKDVVVFNFYNWRNALQVAIYQEQGEKGWQPIKTYQAVTVEEAQKDHLMERVRQGKVMPIPAQFSDVKLGAFEIR